MLDPFCGSGTALVVAKQLGRNYIGIDINPDYCKLAEKRLAHTLVSLLCAKDIVKSVIKN